MHASSVTGPPDAARAAPRRTRTGLRFATSVARLAAAVIVAALTAALPPAQSRGAAAQSVVGEPELARAGGDRRVSLRLGGTSRRVTTLPIEVYVARVIAGEGEPDAPAAARQALAIAIRTYAAVNARRHAREGYGLCDTTHCQVLRASTAPARAAALATAGRILTYNGSPAEVFYSASCGGRSERAFHVWPGADFPYLQTVVDDVHDDEVPWTLELPLGDIQQSLRGAGFSGARLTGVDVEERNESGRVVQLRLHGLQPETITGPALRNAIGPRALRSTAFVVRSGEDTARFMGVGYGHGVGMCVVGAGARARRGEGVDDILHAYYPGLTIQLQK